VEEGDVQRRIQRSGGILVFDPEIRVFHYKRENLREYFRQHFWYGVSHGRMIHEDRSATKLSHIGAIAFLAMPFMLFLLTGSVIITLASWFALIGGGCLVTYVAAGGRKIWQFPYVASSTVAWLYSESVGLFLGLIGLSKKGFPANQEKPSS
jgi:hypothetical protein